MEKTRTISPYCCKSTFWDTLPATWYVFFLVLVRLKVFLPSNYFQWQYHKHNITSWTVTIPYNMFHPRLVLDKTWWNILLVLKFLRGVICVLWCLKIWKILLWIHLKNNYDPINVREGPAFITSSNDWNLHRIPVKRKSLVFSKKKSLLFYYNSILHKVIKLVSIFM